MKTDRATYEFPLVGPGGEPIDLARTILSHGIASLPPMAIDEREHRFEVTLPVPGGKPRTVRVMPGRPGFGRVEVAGRPPGEATPAADSIRLAIAHDASA